LTRRFDLQTKLKAFHKGVDDILTVPFSPKELAARTLAVMRRTYRDSLVFAPVIRLDGLEIDMRRPEVTVGGQELRLTVLERSLLYLLAANAGRPVSREQILDCLWGADYVSQSNVVDRHVCNLRMKLGRLCRRPPHIATVPGCGYR
jgi:DNA-binding response OmpR family regulator